MKELFWKGMSLVSILYFINVFMPDLVMQLESHRGLLVVDIFLDIWFLIKVIALIAVVVMGVKWVTGDSR